MSNILHYIKRTSSTTFKELPFNEVDSMILSQVAYSNFGYLEDSKEQYFVDLKDNPVIINMVSNTWNPENNAKLIQALSASERFGSISWSNYVNIMDLLNEQQFSAITFNLTNGQYYIAYRGTNATFVGWKEDFNMSYLEEIPSQNAALNYFEDIFLTKSGKYFLGGHSKGGNLAMFAAIHAPRESRESILGIYNHDGPGLRGLLEENSVYDEMKSRIHKTIPQSSIIGLIFEQTADFYIVKSESRGIMQHDPFSWSVSEERFVYLDAIDLRSKYAHNLILSWLQSMDEQTIEECLGSIYNVLKASELQYISELSKLSPQELKVVLKGLKNINPILKKKWLFVTKSLVKLSFIEGINIIRTRQSTQIRRIQ